MNLDLGRLGKLSSPLSFHEPLDISGFSTTRLINMLEDMITIRCVENQIAMGKRDGFIGGPVHLGVGQEAVAVGVSTSLNSSDFVFGAHRSHSHLLALGGDIYKLFAEVLGRHDGHSRGYGGSMHLLDQSVGFYGSVPIVAGTVSLAVGAAMSSRMQNKDSVSIAYFGDGACEEGVIHESLNLASVQKDPVIFVVENNLFSSHMHISLRQPFDSTARFALSHGLNFKVVDGNDVVAVSNAASELIDSARQGLGPGFLEAVTYRWYGHVDWREDVDVGVCRSQSDLDNWKLKDPINRLSLALFKSSDFSQDDLHQLTSTINSKVSSLWRDALSSSSPNNFDICDHVYSS